MYESPWKLDEDIESSNVKITSKVPAYSLVSYTPSLQEYGSAIIYNIGRMFPVQEVVTLSPLVALKEAKALCVPVAQYSEEGLPTVQLDHSHSRFQVILISLQNHKTPRVVGEVFLMFNLTFVAVTNILLRSHFMRVSLVTCALPRVDTPALFSLLKLAVCILVLCSIYTTIEL